MNVDVTDKVDFQMNDDEVLPITTCVCGKIYRPWEFIISIYEDNAYKCENCGRKLFFRSSIHVFEIVEEQK